jgi:hypothetical protein
MPIGPVSGAIPWSSFLFRKWQVVEPLDFDLYWLVLTAGTELRELP